MAMKPLDDPAELTELDGGIPPIVVRVRASAPLEELSTVEIALKLVVFLVATAVLLALPWLLAG